MLVARPNLVVVFDWFPFLFSVSFLFLFVVDYLKVIFKRNDIHSVCEYQEM